MEELSILIRRIPTPNGEHKEHHGQGGHNPNGGRLEHTRPSNGTIPRCEFFLSHQRTTAVDRVGLAAFHMLSTVQLWGHQLKKEHLGMGWEDFKELCTIWFGPPTHTNPLDDLILLKQTGSVAEYQKLF
ncbi:uncharacterized protein [Aristolochia californica]|uniref:uncharacterized protein n=1 Tax=Aristolochia californica TaxID=171875 RepID=UPI0035D5489D